VVVTDYRLQASSPLYEVYNYWNQ